MPPIIITIAIAIILGIVIFIINKKSIDRDNANASSITETNSELNKKFETVSETMDSIDKSTKTELESIHSDLTKIESTEEEISDSIDKLKKETENAINETKQHADELYDNLARQLEEKVNALTSILESLNEESSQLRDELNKQKKKLNFYANIDEAAENLIIKEDTQERNRKLEAIRKQISSKEKETKYSQSSADGESQLPISETILGSNQEKNEYEIEEQYEEGGLDPEQEYARRYMDDTNDNVFVTGKAGTGKSFLLDAFRLTTNKSIIVLAPTGIAALNVNGATLHSTFGYNNLVSLGVDEITEDKIKLKKAKWTVLEHVDTIVIDEISMVRADVFQRVDRILKVIHQSDLPFGGKQMVVFGDLFQLPPIATKPEYEFLHDKFGGIYFFHSDAFKAGSFKFIELTFNHRQKEDKEFFEILNRIRVGETTEADLDKLNARYTPDQSAYDRITALFPRKEDAERVNRDQMEKIESAEFTFKAKTILDKQNNENTTIEKSFPISEELHLRLGAIVMMVANDPEGRWVNGTVGIVKDLSKNRIVVSFGEGKNYEIHPLEFDEQEITYVDGKITYEKVYSVTQYPIVPAYAITIHKSQGQTYKEVMCDVKKCFANGQAYVALSRCASLEGLHLKNIITPASIRVDHEVVDFYRSQLASDLL